MSNGGKKGNNYGSLEGEEVEDEEDPLIRPSTTRRTSSIDPPPFHGQHSRLPDIKALAGEFFGTATLVQIGCGANAAALLFFDNENDDMWQVGAIWALAATLGIYLSAAQSGGHLNPAVTLAFCLVRRDDFRWQFLLPYWIAQLLGAFCAGAINLFLFTTAIRNFEEGLLQSQTVEVVDGRSEEDFLLKSATIFASYWSLDRNVENGFHAALVEAFGTGFVCLVVFAATNRKTSIPPVAVPAFVGIAFGVMVSILRPLTGASLNPARDMGPRLVTLFAHWGGASLRDWLPYFLGPLIGGPVGAFLADHVLLLD